MGKILLISFNAQFNESKTPPDSKSSPHSHRKGHFSWGSVCFCFCTGFLTFLLCIEKNGVTVYKQKNKCLGVLDEMQYDMKVVAG